MKRVALLLLVAVLFLGCQGSTVNEAGSEVATPGESPPHEGGCEDCDDRHEADNNIASGSLPVVLAASFLDPIGSIMTVDPSESYSTSGPHLTTDSSDAILRSFGGILYVVNRGTASIQVINPSDFSLIANYSVGTGTNPQDINVVSNSKAYVTRLDAHMGDENTDDILVIDPFTGDILNSIDLTPYTDEGGDRLARAAQTVLIDDKLLVLMQDLSMDFEADFPGKVAVIDTNGDRVNKVIELDGYNPSDITYSPLSDTIYVANTGRMINFMVDITDDTGGIETIDPETLTSEGIAIDDASFGGVLNEVRIASEDRGYTIVDFTRVAVFDPVDLEVTNAAIYTSPGFYLPDITADGDGNLLVAEIVASGPGVIFIDGSAGEVIAGPVEVGAPPVSIAFVDKK